MLKILPWLTASTKEKTNNGRINDVTTFKKKKACDISTFTAGSEQTSVVCSSIHVWGILKNFTEGGLGWYYWKPMEHCVTVNSTQILQLVFSRGKNSASPHSWHCWIINSWFRYDGKHSTRTLVMASICSTEIYRERNYYKVCWTKERGAREEGSIDCHVLPVHRKTFNKATGLTSHGPSCLVLMTLNQVFPVRNGKAVSAAVC